MTMYRIINTLTGHRETETLERASQITGLEIYEILWAMEEFGEAETDTHFVREVHENLSTEAYISMTEVTTFPRN